MMRQIISLLLSLWLMTTTVIAQDQIPYRTYTQSITGETVETQIAYEPLRNVQTDLEEPSGFAYDEIEEVYYISDQKQALILKIDLKQQRESTIRFEEFKSPQGLFVDEENLYIADEKAEAVFVLSKETEKIIKVLHKPDDPLYGLEERFRPTGVIVSEQNILYVLSKGNSGGLIRFNQEGEFMGYFASNEAQTGLFTWLKDKFFTEKQKAKFFKNIPSTPSSMSIDEQGLVYTVTRNMKENGLKKFNAAGINLLQGTEQAFQQYDFTDLDVDGDGNIYTLFSDGTIYVFNPDGQMFFIIKSPFSYQSLKGQIESGAYLYVDANKNIHILDDRHANIQIYEPSEYAEKLYDASVYYQDGRYQDGEETWDQVRRQNASYRLPQQALAKAYFQNHEYRKALDAFDLANDKQGYSNAFWEIRNDFFQTYLGLFFALILLVSIAYLFFKRSMHHEALVKGKKKFEKRWRETRFSQFFAPMRLAMNDPREAFYQLRYFDILSIKQATLYYFIAFLIYLSSFKLKAFLFQGTAQNQSLIQTFLMLLLPLLLLVLSNYLVSTIQDGEGRLKDVYTASSLVFAPYIVWSIPIYLLSNALTLNEAFLFDFLILILLFASVYRLFAMIQEVHNYSFKETVKNILLTLFTALMLTLFVLMLFIFGAHLMEVIIGLMKEVVLRV